MIRHVSGLPSFVLTILMACAPSSTATRADDETGGDRVSMRIITEHPQPMIGAATDGYRAVRLSTDAARTATILSALSETVADIAFVETPLREAVNDIAAKAGIASGFDTRVLDETGFDFDTPVTAEAAGRPLKAILRSILEPLGATFVVRHGQLLVTTHERSQDPGYLERFLYPLWPDSDPAEVRDMIEATIAPETWDAVGGTASIVPLPPDSGAGIVVSQTEEVHERILGVLAGLDAVIWRADGGEEGIRPKVVRSYPVDDPATREELAQSLVELSNDALPRGRDPDAVVRIVGESIVVQSESRAFHVMAASIITAVRGVESIVIEEEDEEAVEDEPVAAVHATRWKSGGP